MVWCLLCSTRRGQCITALLHSLNVTRVSSTFSTMRRSQPVVDTGIRSEACFEASSWVITDIRNNIEMAGVNAFTSAGCCRLRVVGSVLSVTPSSCLLFSRPLSPSLPQVFVWCVDCLTSSVHTCCVVLCYCQPNDFQMSAEVGADNRFSTNECFLFFCTWALSPSNTLLSG